MAARLWRRERFFELRFVCAWWMHGAGLGVQQEFGLPAALHVSTIDVVTV
jgi:hypothetical protein